MIVDNNISTPQKSTAPTGVDDAVGVPKRQWYIAIVNHRSERAVADKLAQMDVETYVPVQEVIRVWKNGRKKKIEHVVIPAIVFIHCSEKKRREVVTLPFVYRFMTDKASSSANSLNKPVAVVPDKEIDKLKFMLGQSDIPVSISDRPFKTGESVRVIRGSLAGLVGEVIDLNSSNSDVVVALDFFGCARLTIATVNLEPA